MSPDLDALATELYVTIDDLLIDHPDLAPERPPVGIVPQLSDAELITLSVLQALLGFTSEARFIRHARTNLRHLFPYVPDRPGYNKRLRHAADLLRHVIRHLATACAGWDDDLWVIDSTPVECARSRETVKRSNLAGAANYGYCRSHSRWYWGFRLHLIATPRGLPIAFALASPKHDERVIARDMNRTGFVGGLSCALGFARSACLIAGGVVGVTAFELDRTEHAECRVSSLPVVEERRRRHGAPEQHRREVQYRFDIT